MTDLTEKEIKELFMGGKIPRNLANFFLEWECKIVSFKEREEIIDGWLNDKRGFLGRTS